MKKNLPTILTGLMLVAILVAYMVCFQVRFTEKAVLRTFGKVRDVVSEPGLYRKWPWPIQDIDVYDARTRVLQTHTEQTATRNKKTLIVTSFVFWRIENPSEFRQNFKGDVGYAERILRQIVETNQKEVIGQYDFSQIISKDPSRLRFDEIEATIGDRVRAAVGTQYGIAIDMFGIKQLALPEDVTQAVFSHMKEERNKLAAQYTAEGEAIKRDIVADAHAKANTILWFADQRAQEYRSQGTARAAEYYAELQKDEQLALFLDRLRKLREILKDRTTIVLDWTQYPFTEFRQQGRLTPTTQSTEDDVLDDPAAMGARPGSRTVGSP